MMISTKGRYALRMMVDLMNQGSDACVSLRAIAERQDISLKYLEQVAKQLADAGLVKSIRGARGGYTLARKPSKISMGEILRAAEGSCAPVACLEEGYGICPRRKECNTIDFWEGLDRVIEDYVDGVKLSDLYDKDMAALSNKATAD